MYLNIVSVSSDLDNGPTKLSLEPVHKTKRIGSIGQCSSGFNAFIAIYTVKFQAVTSALMKYCEIV